MIENFLKIILGPEKFCRLFHKPQYSLTMEYFGGWCRPCGIYFGPDRRA
jgi:hypothetical protein